MGRNQIFKYKLGVMLCFQYLKDTLGTEEVLMEPPVYAEWESCL
jgi:hypothetical protein